MCLKDVAIISHVLYICMSHLSPKQFKVSDVSRLILYPAHSTPTPICPHSYPQNL